MLECRQRPVEVNGDESSPHEVSMRTVEGPISRVLCEGSGLRSSVENPRMWRRQAEEGGLLFLQEGWSDDNVARGHCWFLRMNYHGKK